MSFSSKTGLPPLIFRLQSSLFWQKYLSLWWGWSTGYGGL